MPKKDGVAVMEEIEKEVTAKQTAQKDIAASKKNLKKLIKQYNKLGTGITLTAEGIEASAAKGKVRSSGKKRSDVCAEIQKELRERSGLGKHYKESGHKKGAKNR